VSHSFLTAPFARLDRHGDAGLRSSRRRVRRAVWAVAILFVGWTVLSLVLAGAARAGLITPIPISPITVAVPAGHAIAKKIISLPLEAVLSALLKILQAIFGGVEAKLITGVINGLLAIPNFDTGHVAALEHTTVAISAGMLSAVLTLSILRYYLAGLGDGGSGGFEAIQGLVRVVGAVGFIIAWPGIFSELVQIPKMFDGALLGSGAVQHNVALLFDSALVVGSGAFAISAGLGLIFVILIGFIAATVFIALLWMKVLLSVLMMFLYVSMPLCVVLWPVQELSWLAAAAMRSLFVALIVPCVWAILFALSSAVNADVLTWAPSHSIIDTVIIRPLAGITLMLLCITIPRFLMRTAMIGPARQAGGWAVWRTVTFGMFAMRGAAGVGRTLASAAAEGQPAAQRMIDALPTQMKPPTEAGEGSLAGRVVFGRSGFTKKDTGSESGEGNPPSGTPEDWGAGEESSTRSTGQGASEQGSQPESESARAQPAGQTAGQSSNAGAAGSSGSYGERVEVAGEEMFAAAMSEPRSAEQVEGAMAALPQKAQQRIAEINATDPLKLRDSIAHQLASDAWSTEQQAALRTIGSSRGKAAAEGINHAIARLDEPGQDAPQSSSASTQAPGTAGNAAQAPKVSGASGDSGGDSGGPPPVGPPSEEDEDGRSLGTDLPEQPAIPPETGGTDTSALTDIEPFLE
jgi:hypothetical protein